MYFLIFLFVYDVERDLKRSKYYLMRKIKDVNLSYSAFYNEIELDDILYQKIYIYFKDDYDVNYKINNDNNGNNHFITSILID